MELRVSEDKLQLVVMDCEVPPDGVDAVKENLYEKLTEVKAADEAFRIDLESWLTEHAEGGKIEEAILYEGVPPKPPDHGRIEWEGDFFTPGFYQDPETGALDYRRPKAQPNVEDGQLLARVIPPTPGEAGIDVLGKMIPPEEPREAVIRAEKNVRVEGYEYYSTMNGRIRWASDGLSVDEVLTIEGDVGLETGHIKHPGALEVRGDILEGCEVEADGDIEIGGMIEPAQIRAGGRLVVRGGIAGNEDHLITVKGDIEAKYILDANIESHGDIKVEKEIDQAHIKTRGAIEVESGRIVGGDILALKGVTTQQAGSDAVIRTVITVGEDFTLAKKIAELEKRRVALDESRSKIYRAIEPLKRHIDSLPKARKMAVVKLAEQFKQVDQELHEVVEELSGIRHEASDRAVHKVVVNGTVFPEAMFVIRGEPYRIKENQQGPLQAIFSDGEVRLLSITKV